MAKTNLERVAEKRYTHEGARARHTGPLEQLQRVLQRLPLWEDKFYIEGASNADLLKNDVIAATQEEPVGGALIMERARSDMNMRHAPLLAAVEFCHRTEGGSNAVHGGTRAWARGRRHRARGRARRDPCDQGAADRRPEARAACVAEGRRAVVHEMRRAPAREDKGAGKSITLRDAVFLTHGKRTEDLISQMVARALEVPDAWETNLSGSADEAETFTRLLAEEKLGDLASLGTLRNMDEAGVNETSSSPRSRRRRPARRTDSDRDQDGSDVLGGSEGGFNRCKSEVDLSLGQANVIVDVSRVHAERARLAVDHDLHGRGHGAGGLLGGRGWTPVRLRKERHGDPVLREVCERCSAAAARLSVMTPTSGIRWPRRRPDVHGGRMDDGCHRHAVHGTCSEGRERGIKINVAAWRMAT